jgi:hypothetical protein
METKFEFLKKLDRDLRGAAARERLAIEETEQRLADGGTVAPFGGGRPPFAKRRGTSPAPRRRTWAMVAAASIAVLILAGSIGFVATGGSPFVRSEAAPASGPADSADAVGATGSTPGTGGFTEPTTKRLNVVHYEAFASDEQRAAYLGQATASPAPAAAPREVAATRPGEGQRDLSKIVRDGRIGIVVNDGDFQATRAAINQIAVAHGGFVLSSSTQGRRGTFVLRVDDRRFEDALNAIGDLGVKVEFEDQTGQDVTAEFIDLKARQQILQARKEVLLGFLRQANSVGETLSLYNRVEEAQLQLEQIQGNLRFIHNQVTQATIRVQVREKAVQVESFQEVDKPSLGQAWDRAMQGFLNVVAAVVIGLGYLVPVAVIALVAFVGWRLVRRRTSA